MPINKGDAVTNQTLTEVRTDGAKPAAHGTKDSESSLLPSGLKAVTFREGCPVGKVAAGAGTVPGYSPRKPL